MIRKSYDRVEITRAQLTEAWQSLTEDTKHILVHKSQQQRETQGHERAEEEQEVEKPRDVEFRPDAVNVDNSKQQDTKRRLTRKVRFAEDITTIDSRQEVTRNAQMIQALLGVSRDIDNIKQMLDRLATRSAAIDEHYQPQNSEKERLSTVRSLTEGLSRAVELWLT